MRASEDRALIISGAMVLLLTLALYGFPAGRPELGYLYLLPVFGAALALQERAALSASLLAVIAMSCLRAVEAPQGAFWSTEFALRLAVFSIISCGLIALTAGLRRRRDDVEALSEELSSRLGLVQAIGSLARQAELTPDLDALAARAGEIIADAVGSERHAIFVAEGRGERLQLIGADSRAARGLEALAAEEGGRILKGVFETGAPRILDTMLVLPLRARQSNIGVLCLLDRRGAAGFSPQDIQACEQMAGFAAGLLSGALLFRRELEERRTVGRMAKLLVGRESKMRELKERLQGVTRL